jgi:hypothetical protein
VDKHKQPAGLRNLAQVAAGLLIWVVTTIVATRTLHGRPESVALRVGMVILGVGGFIPWLVSVARLIMSQDEFSQRLHLVAVALTCALTAVLVLTGDYLQTAGLIGEVSLQSIWLGMGVLWWLSIAVATWYYR